MCDGVSDGVCEGVGVLGVGETTGVEQEVGDGAREEEEDDDRGGRIRTELLLVELFEL